MDKINIYINSKNRDLSEQISNFTVRIPQNLLRLSQGEYFTLNVNGFYCYNSWFNCIDNFNNEFHIMDARQCGNDRPGFGVHSVTQKLRAYNIIRVLNIIKLKLYNII